MDDNNDPCDDSDGDEYADCDVDHEEEDRVAVMVTMVGCGSWCLQLVLTRQAVGAMCSWRMESLHLAKCMHHMVPAHHIPTWSSMFHHFSSRRVCSMFLKFWHEFASEGRSLHSTCVQPMAETTLGLFWSPGFLFATPWGGFSVFIGRWWMGTPLKINIESENDGLEDDFAFPGVYSQVPCQSFVGESLLGFQTWPGCSAFWPPIRDSCRHLKFGHQGGLPVNLGVHLGNKDGRLSTEWMTNCRHFWTLRLADSWITVLGDHTCIIRVWLPWNSSKVNLVYDMSSRFSRFSIGLLNLSLLVCLDYAFQLRRTRPLAWEVLSG